MSHAKSESLKLPERHIKHLVGVQSVLDSIDQLSSDLLSPDAPKLLVNMIKVSYYWSRILMVRYLSKKLCKSYWRSLKIFSMMISKEKEHQGRVIITVMP